MKSKSTFTYGLAVALFGSGFVAGRAYQVHQDIKVRHKMVDEYQRERYELLQREDPMLEERGKDINQKSGNKGL